MGCFLLQIIHSVQNFNFMYYVERTILLFIIQLGTFNTNLKGALATLFGFSTTDLASIEADYEYMQWVVKCNDAIEAFASSYIAYQHMVRYGAKDVSLIVEPVFPSLGTPPAIVLAGIQKRFVANANKIKASPLCTEDIQKKLGIYSSSPAAKEVESPDLKVIESAGYPTINFHKYHNDGINLYRDKGDGKGYGTVPYRTVLFSPFTDKDVPAEGHSAIYKYKGIYLSHDEETGNFSAEVSITIAGR